MISEKVIPRIYLRDANDVVFDVLDRGQYFNDKLTRYIQGKASILELKMVKKEDSYQMLKAGIKASFILEGEEFWMNCVKVEQNEKFMNLTFLSLGLEFNNDQSGPYKSTAPMTFQQYLNVFDPKGILEIGLNEVSDKKIAHEWTGSQTKLARIFSLATVFNAEIDFVSKLNPNGSLKKIVLNVYREHNEKDQGLGQDKRTSTYFFGDNIKTISKTEDTYDLYTSITPLGKDGLTIKDIEAEVKDEDGNLLYVTYKTSKTNYPDPNTLYAVQGREQFPSNNVGEDRWTNFKTDEMEYTSANALYGYALSQLKINSVPKIEWSIEGYIDAKIGDTIRIADESYKPTLYLEARIVEQEISITDPKQNKSTFSNVTEIESQISPDLLTLMNKLVEQNKTWNVSIITNKGVVFKNGIGDTTLTAKIYNGSIDITKDVTVRWYKDDVWTVTAYSLNVLADQINQVDQKAVYRAEAIDTNGNIRGLAEVTISKVDDGEKGDPGIQGLQGPKGDTGVAGANGKTPYFHTAWANSEDGITGFSTSVSLGKKYLGVYTDYNQADSTNPKSYKWTETSNAIEQNLAWSWSSDGKDRFTREKPGENIILNGLEGVSITSTKTTDTDFYSAFKINPSYQKMSNWTANNTTFTLGFSWKSSTSLPSGASIGLFFKDEPWTWAFSAYNGVSGTSGSISKTGVNAGNLYNSTQTGMTVRLTNVPVGTVITITNLFVIAGTNQIFRPSPLIDYDNAVPRYIGRSLKDSTNPADFTWEPNPDRKPWTVYTQGLNGEGFSLMPYGENKILDSSFESSGLSLGTVNSATKSYDTSKKNSGNRSVKVVTSTTTTDSGLSIQYSGLTVGTKYTLSVYIYTDNNNMTLRLRIANTSVMGQQQNTLIPKGDWQRVDYTFIAAYASGYYLLMDQNVTFWVDDIKLEPANTMGIPTPWTPAPTDKDENGDTGQAQLAGVPRYIGTAALPYDDPYKYTYTLNPEWVDLNNNLISQGKVDSGSYKNDRDAVWESISNMVTAKEHQKIVDQANTIISLQNDMRNNLTDATEAVKRIDASIVGINNILANTVEKWTFINNYMIAGEDGLSIGDLTTNLKILISEDKISFMDGGTEVAYFTNQEFKINRGMIVEKLQINTHVIGRLDDNHTIISYVG